MLSIDFIRENEKAVRKAIKDKGVELNLDKLLELDERRRELQQSVDGARHEMNQTADAVARAEKTEKNLLIAKGKDLKEMTQKSETELKAVEGDFAEMMFSVPNIPSDDTPIGPDESANVEIGTWGEKPQFAFEPKDHIELGLLLDGLDLERGAKVAGSRGYFLKNEVALLHWAVLWHTFKRMRERGFTVMVPPIVVREMALVGSGHFPADKEEVYEVEEYGGEKAAPERGAHSDSETRREPRPDKPGRERKFLAGTSEPSLLAYRADEIVDYDELPLKYSGLSACYRREVGGYGKDTKGLYRVHEFTKVEQVIICEADLSVSLPLFEEMKKNSTDLLQELELPYRVIQISTGDMGVGKYKMYDIETWMPSRQAYGETHSNSHLTDWQMRRLNIRYRTKDGELTFPHAMNNTAIASPRILIAILENNQQKDGSIKIPEVLVPYLGFDVISPKT